MGGYDDGGTEEATGNSSRAQKRRISDLCVQSQGRAKSEGHTHPQALVRAHAQPTRSAEAARARNSTSMALESSERVRRWVSFEFLNLKLHTERGSQGSCK